MPQINAKKDSPNRYDGRNGWKPDMICNHITEGGYSGAVSWLCNPDARASAHFVVSRKGHITQLVDLTDSSWCNGNSTSSSSRLYYKNSLNAIVRSRATNANYYTVSIEHEGYSYKDGYGALTEEQYQATLWLHRYIISEIKRLYNIDMPIDREHIIGHYEIDPVGKPNCPAPNQGKNFPFDRLISDLKSGTEEQVDKMLNKHLYVLKDTTLYSTAGYEGSTEAILATDTIVYGVKKNTANGIYLALKDENNKDYLSPAAWCKDFNNFDILEDYVPGKLHKYLTAIEDVISYSTAGYEGSQKGTIKKGQVVYCEKIHYKHGVYYAVKNPDTMEFLNEAWIAVADINKFSVSDVYTPVVSVKDIQITNISTELEVGDSLELSIKITPENATNTICKISSNDINLATIDGNILIAKAAGKVIIKVECDGKETNKEFTILAKEEPIIQPEPPVTEPTIPEEPEPSVEPTEPEIPVVEPSETEPIPVAPETPSEEPVKPSKKNGLYKIIHDIIQVFVEVIKSFLKK